MGTSNSARTRLGAIALIALIGAVALADSAQAQRGRRGQARVQSKWDPVRSPQTTPPPPPGSILLGPKPVDLLRVQMPIGHQGVDRSLPIFQGFPTFPSDVPGFGGYPGGKLPVPYTEGLSAPSLFGAGAPQPPDRWPSWFGGDLADAPDGFTPQIALLNQFAQGVWFRLDAAAAFVPLTFYDKYRVLRRDAEVSVRHSGSFQLSFSEGSYVRCFGTTTMRLVDLDAELIEIEIRELSRVRVFGAQRPIRVRFVPGGATLDCAQAKMEFEAVGDVVVVTNHGAGTAHLETAVGNVQLPRTHRLRIYPRCEGEVIGTDLVAEGDVTTSVDGRDLSVDVGPKGGAVSWSGARFRLPAGARLRIDPLAGREFPSQRPNARR